MMVTFGVRFVPFAARKPNLDTALSLHIYISWMILACRLPVFQGSTGSYIAPLLGLMETGKWSCALISNGKTCFCLFLTPQRKKDHLTFLTGLVLCRRHCERGVKLYGRQRYTASDGYTAVYLRQNTPSIYCFQCYCEEVKKFQVFLPLFTLHFLRFGHAFDLTVWKLIPWFQLSGSIMVANAVQVFLGVTGIIGIFVSYVSPLTISAYLCTIVTSLAGICADIAKPNWGIAFL